MERIGKLAGGREREGVMGGGGHGTTYSCFVYFRLVSRKKKSIWFSFLSEVL